MRKKIIVPFGTDNGVRNFLESKAFQELEKRHDVHFLVFEGVTRPVVGKHVHWIKNYDVAGRSRRRMFAFFASMKRYANRCTTFPIKYHETFYKQLPASRRYIMDVLTLPGIAETFISVNEALLKTSAVVDDVLNKIEPDLAIIPCAFNDAHSLDVLKSAKQKKIQTLMLMFNWDNVCTKGVLPFLPDYMSVWGPQTFKHAVDIQKMPANRIKVLGAPQFEVYRQPLSMSSADLRRLNGIPEGKKVILFTGMSRLTDEIGLLERLDNAVENGELPGAHIHYRPHPWKVTYPNEKNFFDCSFRHTTMDIQLKDHYVSVLKDVQYRKSQRNNFVPDYSYYPSLFAAVDGVISPGTTMGIEAMVMGKPVLVRGFDDEGEGANPDRFIYKYDHYDCWDKMPSVVVCRDRNDIVKDTRELLKLANDPKVSSSLKEEVKYIVDLDEHTFADRLNDYVESILKA
jgi:hypothetical protein